MHFRERVNEREFLPAGKIAKGLIVDSRTAVCNVEFEPSFDIQDSSSRGPIIAMDSQQSVHASRAAATFMRGFDMIAAGAGLLCAAPVMVAVAGIILASSPGPAIFAQVRVGRRRRPFTCYKFRTMRLGTPHAASHEVSESAVTPIGRFLRRTKLDELPQLWNVLLGDMSLVGPRPCLPSQTRLIVARESYDVFSLRPGITGLAQVRGIDMSDPERLATLDSIWLKEASISAYLRILALTLGGRGSGDRVARDS